MKFEELVAKRDDLLNQVDTILATAKESGILSEDDDKKVTALHAEIDGIKAQIDDAQQAADRAAKAAQKQSELRNQKLNPVINRIKQLGTGAPSMPSNNVEGTFRLPATVRRSQPKAFTAPVEECDGVTAHERAYRFGQWALARATMCLPQFYNFHRSVEFCRENGILNTMGEGGGDVSGAGVFVPEEFSTDLIRLVERYGVIRREVGVQNMTSDTKKVPRRTGGMTAYFTSEAGAGTLSDPTYNEVQLVAKKLTAFSSMSNELVEDAVVDIANLVLEEAAQAYAYKEDLCGFNGDGSSTYGGILGIRNRLDTLTAGTAPGHILGAGNAYSELTLANFSSVIAALPEFPGISPKWYCHKTFFYTVMQPLALAAGGTTAGDIVNGIAMQFLGYPVVFSQVFPSVAANSQIPVIFGDLRMGCKFGDRRRYSVDFSTEATVGGVNLWEKDLVGVRATERFDFLCHDFGTDSVAGPICGLEMAAS